MNKFMTLATLGAFLVLPLELKPAAEPLQQIDIKQIPTLQLIQAIKDEYKIKGPEDCIMGLSKKTFNNEELRFEARYQEACVVAGHKHIFFDDPYTPEDIENPARMNPKVRELISRHDSPVGYFFAPDHGGIIHLFMYTKTDQAELDAYRLALARLQGTTNYLVGKLLGYSLESIQFFYQATIFITLLPSISSDCESCYVANFNEWPTQIKAVFEQFEKTPNSLQIYRADAESARQWLVRNEKKTVTELKREINQREATLGANNNDYCNQQ